MKNKQFLDQLVKNQQEAHEKLIEMLINDNYTTGSLLDYLCHKNYHKRINIYLSGQKNMSIPHQISFVGKSEEDECVVMFFCC